MDVGDPSNFARVLALYDNNHDAIVSDISGATFTDEQIADTISRVFKQTGYVLDPHGACGYRALAESLRSGEVGVFLETAHPAKFRDTVERIIGMPVAIPEKLQDFMRGNKVSVALPADFDAFKSFLLS
jgi:threonine synthase